MVIFISDIKIRVSMKIIALLILSINIYANCKIDIDNLKLLTYKKMPVYDEKKEEVVHKRVEFNFGVPPYPDFVELIIPKSGKCSIEEIRVQQFVAPVNVIEPKRLIKALSFVYRPEEKTESLIVSKFPLEEILKTSKDFHVYQLKVILNGKSKILYYSPVH